MLLQELSGIRKVKMPGWVNGEYVKLYKTDEDGFYGVVFTKEGAVMNGNKEDPQPFKIRGDRLNEIQNWLPFEEK